eukprot:COSAG01_NODE_1350_length_10605_cov_43.649743_1_plen_695_part_00
MLNGRRHGAVGSCCSAPQPSQLPSRVRAVTALPPAEDGAAVVALRAELAGLRLLALQQKALEAGVEEHAIDTAIEGSDPKRSLVALILSRAAARAAETQQAARRAALRAELSGMKPLALCARAKEMGVDDAVVDQAYDADDVKGSLMNVIVQRALIAPKPITSIRLQQGSVAHGGGSATGQVATPTGQAQPEPEPEPGYALGPAGEGTAAQVASRRELTGMKLSALRRRAQAEGVDDGAMEAASDGNDERRDLVQLIMAQQQQQQPWDDQGAAVGSEQLELRAKLGSLKMSALRRRAVADGVRSEQMDAAADGDDERASLVAAIVEHTAVPRSSIEQQEQVVATAVATARLVSELRGLRPSVLKQRALEVGVKEHAIDAALDEDDVKGSFVALILAASAPETQQVARRAALRAELSGMKPLALCARAKEMGVDEATAEDAFDADDVKGSLIAIILDHVRDSADRVAPAADDGAAMSTGGSDLATLRAELSSLKLHALHTRGQTVGVHPGHLGDALDADDPKAATIELILEQATAAGTAGTTAAAASERQPSSARAGGTRPHHGGGATAAAAAEAAPPAAPPPAAAQRPTKHVMLSYNWDHQKQVKRVYDMLTALGTHVWMDIAGGMSGDIYESMAAGVSNASVIVCFMCDKYQQSTNCMLEVSFGQTGWRATRGCCLMLISDLSPVTVGAGSHS